jgi:hypothetical protein
MVIKLEDKGVIEDWEGEAIKQNIEANHWFRPTGGLGRPYHGFDSDEGNFSNYPYPSPIPPLDDSSSDNIPKPAPAPTPSPSDDTSFPDTTGEKLTDSDYQDHYLAEQRFENNLYNLTKEAGRLTNLIDSQIKYNVPSSFDFLINNSNDNDDNNHREKEQKYEQSFNVLTAEATRLVNNLWWFIKDGV